MILAYTKSALKKEKCTVPIEDDRLFYRQALNSGLFGLIFEAMDSSIVSKELYDQAMKIYFKFIQKDASQEALIHKIHTVFNTHQIDHFFIKGVRLKQMYSAPYLRGMGDIDVVVREKDIYKTQKILKEEGFILDAKSDIHDFYYYQDLMVEVHQKIYARQGKKDKSRLLDPFSYAHKLHNHLYALTLEYELLHLVYHLMKHILFSGIGLRSFLDISIFTNYYKETLDISLLSEYLKEADLYDFFFIILSFNKRAFDVDCPFIKEELSEEAYQKILTYLHKSGIHGLRSSFNPMAPRLSKNSKLKALLTVLFPSWSTMKHKYPILKYVPFLLPFFYPARWFYLLFKKTKQSFRKLKELKSADEDILYIKDVIKTFKLEVANENTHYKK